MTVQCRPAVPASAPAPGLNPNPCIAVTQIRAAIFALASGQTVSEVREKESWIRFMTGGGASIPALRRLLYEAEIACDDCSASGNGGRAIRMGPVQNPMFARPYPYRW